MLVARYTQHESKHFYRTMLGVYGELTGRSDAIDAAIRCKFKLVIRMFLNKAKVIRRQAWKEWKRAWKEEIKDPDSGYWGALDQDRSDVEFTRVFCRSNLWSVTDGFDRQEDGATECARRVASASEAWRASLKPRYRIDQGRLVENE